MSAPAKLPLAGIRFAGLAPGPFAGMVLADFGADVVRIDRPGSSFSSDVLARHKRSISVSVKSAKGVALLKKLISRADVVIDPFRPGVLERLGLGPEDVFKENERLVYARLTGFRRVGEYAKMAGHDINYAALSGVLSMLGRAETRPTPPINLLADFAGGGLLCALGVVLALFERERSGMGQIVESDMVTGSRYVASFLLLLKRPSHGLPMFTEERGHNVLDSGSPWYDTYETSDGKFMSVGAIEPQFYAELLTILKRSHPNPDSAAHPDPRAQLDRSTWPSLRDYFTTVFRSRPRDEWQRVFVGTDACVAPVLDPHEVGTSGQGRGERHFDSETSEAEKEYGGWPAPAPALSRTPGLDPGRSYGAFGEEENVLLEPGKHTVEVLKEAGLADEEVKKLLDERIVDAVFEDAEPAAKL